MAAGLLVAKFNWKVVGRVSDRSEFFWPKKRDTYDRYDFSGSGRSPAAEAEIF
jgi:hypothetical protein